MANIDSIEAQNKFWTVSIQVKDEDENGKIKKTKETHLVDAVNATDCEKKLHEYMDGTMAEWELLEVKQSKIIVVY
jgi:hypothetical protein